MSNTSLKVVTETHTTATSEEIQLNGLGDKHGGVETVENNNMQQNGDDKLQENGGLKPHQNGYHNGKYIHDNGDDVEAGTCSLRLLSRLLFRSNLIHSACIGVAPSGWSDKLWVLRHEKLRGSNFHACKMNQT